MGEGALEVAVAELGMVVTSSLAVLEVFYLVQARVIF
jgi:hypothetical protein